LTIKISKKAFLEIEDAKEYYNLQKENLGDTFKSDLKSSINKIQTFPDLYPNITDTIVFINQFIEIKYISVYNYTKDIDANSIKNRWL